jgi:hypothetical protein
MDSLLRLDLYYLNKLRSGELSMEDCLALPILYLKPWNGQSREVLQEQLYSSSFFHYLKDHIHSLDPTVSDLWFLNFWGEDTWQAPTIVLNKPDAISSYIRYAKFLLFHKNANPYLANLYFGAFPVQIQTKLDNPFRLRIQTWQIFHPKCSSFGDLEEMSLFMDFFNRISSPLKRPQGYQYVNYIDNIGPIFFKIGNTKMIVTRYYTRLDNIHWVTYSLPFNDTDQASYLEQVANFGSPLRSAGHHAIHR